MSTTTTLTMTWFNDFITYLSNFKNFWNIQIRLDWWQAFSNEITFIRFLTMHLHGICFGVNSNGLDSQFRTGTIHTDSNFAYKITTINITSNRYLTLPLLATRTLRMGAYSIFEEYFLYRRVDMDGAEA